MSDLEMKSFGPFEVKSEDRGEVVAIVATLGVVDKDGDVIQPGAFPPGRTPVKLSGYGHDVITEGAAPVGKGWIYEHDGKAMFEGKYFVSTERGRQAFLHAKEMGPDGEWSFGFPRNVKQGDLTAEWKSAGAKRVIAGLMPIEASPVFVGAGWGTGTLLTKAAEAVEPVAQADGDPAVSVESDDVVDGLVEPIGKTMAEKLNEMLAEPFAAEPAAEPAETEEAKAARVEAERVALEAAVQAKAQRALELAAKEEYERVRRTWKRMGYAA
jgi:hypothetical protein